MADKSSIGDMTDLEAIPDVTSHQLPAAGETEADRGTGQIAIPHVG
jgi:hypothetical protein